MSHIYVNYPMAEKKKFVELLRPEEVAILACSTLVEHGTCKMEYVSCAALTVYANKRTSSVRVVTCKVQ